MSCYEDIPKIKDVVTMSNGFFSHLDYQFLFDITGPQLDILFYADYGEKNIAPVIKLYTPTVDPYPLTDNILEDIGELIVMYYKNKWDRLAAVYNIEYDPIHNYLDDWEDEADGTLDREMTLDRTSTDTLDTTVAHTNTRTDQLSETETRALTNGNTKTFNNSDETEYDSSSTHEIDSINPLVETTQYGKIDEREDNLTKVNSGEDNTVNSGTDTNSIWGFNSSSAVNSDSTTLGTTARHLYGDVISGGTNNSPTEENTGTVTHTLDGSDTLTKTGRYSDTKDGSDTVNHTGTISETGSEGGTLTIANTGTQSNAGSDATTGTNTRVVDEDGVTDEATHRERRGRHFGNIGNLTSQKMIQEEIELWKWNYVRCLLEDVRDFLTLPVYM